MLNTREKAEGKKKGHDNLLRDSYLKIVPVDLYLQFVISDMKGKSMLLENMCSRNPLN